MGLVFTAASGKYEAGDTVFVKSDAVERHHRTPWFIKGKTGTVRAISGPFLDPESRAYGGDGLPGRLLYQVEFSQTDLWGNRYRGDVRDVLLVDVYEQWLEPSGSSAECPA